MKPSIATRVLLSVTMVATVSQAQVASNPPATQHIVTLSFNAAVLQTAEAQKELGALQAKLAPRQAQLQSLNNEVEALRKQLTDAGDKLSDTERETRERSLETKEKDLQRQAEDFRNDSQTESQQVFQKVAQKVYAFLQTYSQQHGYSAVIERGSDTAPVVWYAAGNLDITDELIKAYNAQSPAGPAGLPNAPGSGTPAPPTHR
jgi:Skp family chaperone for outer membrane proteins